MTPADLQCHLHPADHRRSLETCQSPVVTQQTVDMIITLIEITVIVAVTITIIIIIVIVTLVSSL